MTALRTAASQRSILDTSVVISDVRALPGQLAISAVTLAELHFGVLVAPSDSERAHRLRRLTALQARLDALPVDDLVAASYGRLAAVTVAAGRQPPRRVADLLIAATAHAHGARLVTRNPDDFAGLEDHLEVVSV